MYDKTALPSDRLGVQIGRLTRADLPALGRTNVEDLLDQARHETADIEASLAADAELDYEADGKLTQEQFYGAKKKVGHYAAAIETMAAWLAEQDRGDRLFREFAGRLHPEAARDVETMIEAARGSLA